MLKSCSKLFNGALIHDDVRAGKLPMCRSCSASGTSRKNNDSDGDDGDGGEWASVMMPDIVFFGESLPKSISENLE